MPDDIRRLKIVQVPVFVQDRAMYSVSPEQYELLVRNLSSDPLLGAPLKDAPGLRQYGFLGYNVIYRPSPDYREIVLLQLRPAGAPEPQLGKVTLKAAVWVVRKWIEAKVGKWFS